MRRREIVAWGFEGVFEEWSRLLNFEELGDLDLNALRCAVMASADDVYLVARSTVEKTIMVIEILTELAKHGLKLQPDKSQWIASALIDTSFLSGPGFEMERSGSFVCFGFLISA